MNSREKYLLEYEKYKNIRIVPGSYKKKERSILVEVLKVDEDNEQAVGKTVHSGHVCSKTLHWCRKYLEKV